MNLELKRYLILQTDGRRVPAHGLAEGGLGINANGAGICVTHVATGMAIKQGFKDIGPAALFMEKILPLTDWVQKQPELGTDVRTQIQNYYNELVSTAG